MHIIRNAILAGAAAIFLPWTGATSHLSSIAHDAKNHLSDFAEVVARDWGQDFQVPVVRIHSKPNTASEVLGLANPGDKATIDDREPGETVACPAGSSTNEWAHVTDRRTHVSGYVASCYLGKSGANG